VAELIQTIYFELHTCVRTVSTFLSVSLVQKQTWWH